MTPYKILIVEDEGVIVYQLSRYLKTAGYHLCPAAAAGDKAVQIARQEQPDLVLLDIRLQGEMTGLEVAHAVRQFSNIPIIFLTGYLDDTMQAEAMLLPPVAYLTKPINVEALEVVLQQMLDDAQKAVLDSPAE